MYLMSEAIVELSNKHKCRSSFDYYSCIDTVCMNKLFTGLGLAQIKDTIEGV